MSFASPLRPTSLPSATTVMACLRTLFIALAGIGFAALMAYRLSQRVDAVTIAALLGAFMIATAITYPRVALIALLALLTGLGELRRWVEYHAGASGQDPLLLLAPAVVVAMSAGLLLKSPTRPTTPAGKAVALLMGLMILQAFNPIQGGLMVGVAGLLFYCVPLLWFWLGRAYGSEKTTVTVMTCLVLLACVAAAAGMFQVFHGFLPHQQAWLERAGYTSLSVGGRTRPFSLLTSSSEYAHLMGLTIAAAMAVVICGRGRAVILAVPFLFGAMFLQGSRGPVVLTGLAVCIALSVRSGKPVQWLVRGVIALIILGVVVVAGLGRLSDSVVPEAMSPMVQHQADGLLDPFNKEHSTLGIHAGMAAYGLNEALSNPLGRGTGSTTLAARKFGGNKVNAEFDLANVAIGLGLIGALIYAVFLLDAWRSIYRLWLDARSVTALVTAGVLVSTVGQWLNGGMYSVAAVVWFLLGSCDRLAQDLRNAPAESPTGDAA